jgi:hypothetical protein
VGTAGVLRGAGIRVCLVHIDLAFINVITMNGMKVAVVKVVDMVFMPDGSVPAPRTMNVLMVRMNRVLIAHGFPPWLGI